MTAAYYVYYVLLYDMNIICLISFLTKMINSFLEKKFASSQRAPQAVETKFKFATYPIHLVIPCQLSNSQVADCCHIIARLVLCFPCHVISLFIIFANNLAIATCNILYVPIFTQLILL